MERLRFDPRTDWDAKAEELGFTWRHTDGKPYWDETAAYAFSLAENAIDATELRETFGADAA